ncbi:hypothetical protein C1Y40_04153 [Mycobacterium talmoniae]|uniref:Uncharacterized protein n=1 Tax=Mycobacterium talmoniae TaxID=1858794 RepID=A0A2S8BGF8_9MYCO|nr:hypothetical protein C1Y40_04153 [Mycobacterium talmoniae]
MRSLSRTVHVRTARRLLASFTAGAVLAGVGLGWAGRAGADPDPHVPNMAAGYCPGGGMGTQAWLAYCDGVDYPDGTRWHAVQYGLPIIGRPYGLLSPGLQCVVDDGSPVPPPAPAGGCGRAA